MRPKTLQAILLILVWAVLFGIDALASFYEIHLPLIGRISPLAAGVILLPVVVLIGALLNQRIIAWRKAHGKDIAEEQAHEFDDADIISLRPRQLHEHSSTYRRDDL
jgi:hypothetical protein